MKDLLRKLLKEYDEEKAFTKNESIFFKFLNNYKQTSLARSDSAKINDYSEIKYAEFIRILNRTQLAIDDVKSVLTNKSKYNIIYTDSDTYLAKDPNFIPKEEVTSSLESLFA
jgi:hypothetical protein